MSALILPSLWTPPRKFERPSFNFIRNLMSPVISPTMIGQGKSSVTYDQAVMADSPTAWWKMTDVSGNFADSSGNNYTASANGSPTYGNAGPILSNTAEKSVGTALGFGLANPVITTSGFAAEFWVNATVFTGSPVPFANNDSSGNNPATNNKGFLFQFTTGGILNFYLGNNSTYVFVASGVAITTGGWHYFVGTLLGGTVTLYQDNVSVGTPQSLSGSVDLLSTTSLGIYNNGSSDPMPGYMAQFALYSAGLSSTRVAAHYIAAGY